ncbi:MAG: endoribonuclease MazF [bacterium]|nr:endoribonuclease MazF [bacterium]
MVRRHSYVPDRGDIVWLTFTPQAGYEPAGHRPALILSPRIYNERTGLGLVCPITSKVKGYPFEVALPAKGPVTGVVLSDQVKSLDWRARSARFASHAPPKVLSEVLENLGLLLEG